jgi:heme/copper-type cytochrome/quinol oxidase subunit 2
MNTSQTLVNVTFTNYTLPCLLNPQQQKDEVGREKFHQFMLVTILILYIIAVSLFLFFHCGRKYTLKKVDQYYDKKMKEDQLKQSLFY